MQGRVVVITGATSGIGKIAAEALAAQGARIVQVARDRARGEAAVARLREIAPHAAHKVHYADLSRLSEMKRVAADIAAAEPRIDILMNNAGAIFGRRVTTPDGLESTFALNHMSYFVLTALLRPNLAADARIVSTASNAHRRGHLNFADLQSERGYKPFSVYGTSKLCNILFTRELARRLAGTGIVANCHTPGFVATRFGDEAGGLYSLGVRFAKLFAGTQEKGARTMIWLASSLEAARVSGEFFDDCRPGKKSAEAQDDAKARQLWDESERIAQLR